MSVSPNVKNARQVLARSRANTRAQALLAYLTQHGVTVGDPVAQKVEVPLNRKEPTANPVLDLVRAELQVNGTNAGEYFHAIGPKGDLIFSIMSRPDGTTELNYDEKGSLAHTVIGRSGQVLSSTIPIATVKFDASPQAVSCQGVCGSLCGAGLGSQLSACIAGCLAGGPEDEPICAPLCTLLASLGCLYGCYNICCICCNCS
jgi:hypothetical protein